MNLYAYIWTIGKCKECGELVYALSKCLADDLDKTIDEILKDGWSIISMIKIPSNNEDEWKYRIF